MADPVLIQRVFIVLFLLPVKSIRDTAVNHGCGIAQRTPIPIHHIAVLVEDSATARPDRQGITTRDDPVLVSRRNIVFVLASLVLCNK